ncbi:MAG: hypothetical protein SPL08_01865 [Pseudomonadota bacterium]|nr:hypothetical protein [Pseudomonadota bacterium]
MKHFFTLILLGCFVAACSSEVEENRETRSTVYKGQTTWDLYENFGAPTFAVRVSPDEYHFIYRREEVTRDWTRMYFDWCDKVFVVVNDHVVDWDVDGNQCYLNVADDMPVPDGDNPRQNAFERYQGEMNLIHQNTYYTHPANENTYDPEDDVGLF